MPNKLTQEEFISKLTAIWGNQYDYSKAVYENSHTKVLMVCPIHGEFSTTPNQLLRGHACRKCGCKIRDDNRRRTQEQFIKECTNVWGDTYDFSMAIYKGCFEKVQVICPVHGMFEKNAEDVLQGKGCPSCSKERRVKNSTKTQDDFIKEMKSIYGDFYEYSLVDYKIARVPVEIICKKHGVFSATPQHLLEGHGCPKCAYEKISVLKTMPYDNFIKRARMVHQDKYLYHKDTYLMMHSPMKIECGIHGFFWQTPSAHLTGQGCPKCKASHGEAKVRKWLIENHIDFEEQKMFDECKDKRKLLFDFYLPSANVCIEYQGIQHYEEVAHFNRGKKSLELNQKRDAIKREFCKNSNIELIEIKYNEDVSEVLNEKLIKEEKPYERRTSDLHRPR